MASQQPDKSNLSKLYRAISGEVNLGTYDDYENKMQDEKLRKVLYDYITEKHKDTDFGTWEEFNAQLGFTKAGHAGEIGWDGVGNVPSTNTQPSPVISQQEPSSADPIAQQDSTSVQQEQPDATDNVFNDSIQEEKNNTQSSNAKEEISSTDVTNTINEEDTIMSTIGNDRDSLISARATLDSEEKRIIATQKELNKRKEELDARMANATPDEIDAINVDAEKYNTDRDNAQKDIEAYAKNVKSYNESLESYNKRVADYGSRLKTQQENAIADKSKEYGSGNGWTNVQDDVIMQLSEERDKARKNVYSSDATTGNEIKAKREFDRINKEYLDEICKATGIDDPKEAEKQYNYYLNDRIVSVSSPEVERQLGNVKRLSKPIYEKYHKAYVAMQKNSKKYVMNGIGGSIDFTPVDIANTQEGKDEIAAETAIHFLEDAKQQLKNYNTEKGQRDYGKAGQLVAFTANTARGLGQRISNVDNWNFGITDALKAGAIMSIAKKEEAGIPLTEIERECLNAAALNMFVMANAETGLGFQAGQVTADAIPFMLDMMFNPIAGVGNSMASCTLRAIQAGIKRGTYKMTSRAAKRLALDMSKQYASNVVRGTAMALSPMQVMKTESNITNMKIGNATGDFSLEDGNYVFNGFENQKSTWEAFWKGIATQAIENESEFAGDTMLEGIGGIFGKYLGRIGGKLNIGKVGNNLRKVAPGSFNRAYNMLKAMPNKGWYKTINDIKKSAHMSGVFGETNEEIWGGIEQAMIGEEDIDEVLSANNYFDTFVTMLPMQIMFGALGVSGHLTQKYKASRDLKNAKSAIETVFGLDRYGNESKDGFRAIIDDIDFAFEFDEDFGSYITHLANRYDFNTSQKAAILNYGIALQYCKGLDGAESLNNMREFNRMLSSNAYNIGRGIDTDEERIEEYVMLRHDRRRAIFAGYERLGKTKRSYVSIIKLAENGYYVEALTLLARQKDNDPYRQRAIENYIESLSIRQGIIDTLKEDRDSQIDEYTNEINSKVNKDGNVCTALYNGNNVYVVDGAIGGAMTIKYEDGTIEQVSSDNLSFSSTNSAKKLIEQFSAEKNAEFEESVKRMNGENPAPSVGDRITYRGEEGVVVSIDNSGEETKYNVDFGNSTKPFTYFDITHLAYDDAKQRCTYRIFMRDLFFENENEDIKGDSIEEEPQDTTQQNEEDQNEATANEPTGAIQHSAEFQALMEGQSVSLADGTTITMIEGSRDDMRGLAGYTFYDPNTDSSKSSTLNDVEIEKILHPEPVQQDENDGQTPDPNLPTPEQIAEEQARQAEAEAKRIAERQKRFLDELEECTSVEQVNALVDELNNENIPMTAHMNNAVENKLNELNNANNEGGNLEDGEENTTFVPGIGEAIQQKWNDAEKKIGIKRTITLNDGSKITGHYVIAPAGSATSSHDWKNGFKPSEGFPTNERGENVNDRDYTIKANQDAVMDMARDFQMRQDGAPFVLHGVVLGGNNRNMSREISAENGTDSKYLETLNDDAQMYGFTTDDIESIENPTLYFEVEDELPMTTETFAKFNAKGEKSQSVTELATKMGKLILENEDAFNAIIEAIDKFDDIEKFFNSKPSVENLLNKLVNLGIIKQNEVEALVNRNTEGKFDGLSGAGEDILEATLIGAAFNGHSETIKEINKYRAVRRRIIKAIPAIIANRALGDEYSLDEFIDKAIELVIKAKKSEINDGEDVRAYTRQLDIFDQNSVDSLNNLITVTLANEMNGLKPKNGKGATVSRLRELLNKYNFSAQSELEGGSLFDDNRNREDILKSLLEFFGIEYNFNDKENNNEPEQPSEPESGEPNGKDNGQQGNEQGNGQQGTGEKPEESNSVPSSPKAPRGQTRVRRPANNGSRAEWQAYYEDQYKNADGSVNTAKVNNAMRIWELTHKKSKRLSSKLGFRNNDELEVELTPEEKRELLNLGMEFGMDYINAGNIEFKPFFEDMVHDFGDNIRSFVGMVYGMISNDPNLNNDIAIQMDGSRVVRSFDIDGYVVPTEESIEKDSYNIEYGRVKDINELQLLNDRLKNYDELLGKELDWRSRAKVTGRYNAIADRIAEIENGEPINDDNNNEESTGESSVPSDNGGRDDSDNEVEQTDEPSGNGGRTGGSNAGESGTGSGTSRGTGKSGGSNNGNGTTKTGGDSNTEEDGGVVDETDGSTGQPGEDTPADDTRADADAGPDGEFDDNGANTGKSTKSSRDQSKTVGDALKNGDEKVPYRAKSDGLSLNSVIPTAAAQATYECLDEFEDIDDFVMKKLGYSSKEEMFSHLAAEQIDGVAMSISAMEKGYSMVIGDQTGLGKGRQAASIIRYACRQGKTPIFFTQKPSLFSDFYRDMTDIGSEKLKPLIINASNGNIVEGGEKVSEPILDENGQPVLDENGDPMFEDKWIGGKIVYKYDKKDVNSFLKTGKLPKGYDYVLVTYSQIQGTSENFEKRKKALAQLADGNIIVMDESHTAAGKSNTGEYIQDLVKNADGVTFLSATYAKNPSCMPLYAIRSVINDANLEQNDLIKAIERGGVPMQEIMSQAFTASGAMIRRERDMKGVKVDWKPMDVDPNIQRSRYDSVIEIFRRITDFQTRYLVPVLNDIKAEAEKEDKLVFWVSNRARLYNLVNQMTTAIKVEEVIKETLDALSRGEKPYISLAETNSSLLNDFFDFDEPIEKYDISIILKRCIEKTFDYLVKEYDGDGNVIGEERPRLNIDDMSDDCQNEYYSLLDEIDNLVTDLPLSPVDEIRIALEREGYKVAEITGRSETVTIDEDGQRKLEKRSIPDRNVVVKGFNSGEIDVLILNKSGSTGLSIQASTKFKDQRPRHHITLQPQSDTNDEAQMRGRGDRTGQLQHCIYTYIMSHIPAESRIMMMLKKKLASLDANTTSSAKTEFNEVDTVDFGNKYGSQVIVDVMKENDEWVMQMDDPFGWWKDCKSQEDYERNRDKYVASAEDYNKVMKRVGMLLTEEQQEFYEQVIEKYTQLIDALDASGMNDLEIKDMPLDATTLQITEYVKGENPGGQNVFADSAYIEEVECNSMSKPMTQQEVKSTIANSLNGKSEEQYRKDMLDDVNDYFNKEVEKIDSNYEKSVESRFETAKKRIDKKRESDEEKFEKDNTKGRKWTDAEYQERLDEAKAEIERLAGEQRTKAMDALKKKTDVLKLGLEGIKVGHYYLVERRKKSGDTEYFSGVIVGINISDNKSDKTSYIKFALNNGMRVMNLPFEERFSILRLIAQENNADSSTGTGGNYGTDVTDNWESLCGSSLDKREKRYIITGNILTAIAQQKKQEGQIITYTTSDGTVRRGILLPKGVNLTKFGKVTPLVDAYETLSKFWKEGTTLTTADGKITFKYMPRARSKWSAQYNWRFEIKKSANKEILNDKELFRLLDGTIRIGDDMSTEWHGETKTTYQFDFDVFRMIDGDGKHTDNLFMLLKYLTDKYGMQYNQALNFNPESQDNAIKGVKREHKYTVDQVTSLFYDWIGEVDETDTTKKLKELADIVFPVAEKLGMDIQFGDTEGKEVGGFYWLVKNQIKLKYNFFAYNKDPQYRAEVMLHEFIHSVTAYAIDIRKGIIKTKKPLSPELTKAVDELLAIYKALKNEKSLKGMYGLTNEHEMIAEMANPKWRLATKAINMFDRIMGAVSDVLRNLFKDFMPNRKDTALDRIEACLKAMIENFDEDVYMEAYEYASNKSNKGIIKPNEIRVKHGSGAEFSEFDHDFMGNGMGAQAYGYGTYVTEDNGTAVGAAQTASTKKNNKRIKELDEKYQEMLEEFDDEYLNEDGTIDMESEDARKAYEKLNELKKQISDLMEDNKAEGNRNLYEVEIPDNNGENYLVFGKPLTESQKEKITEAVKDFWNGKRTYKISELENAFEHNNGFAVYKALGPILENEDDAVSKFLDELGIIGIKCGKDYVIYNPENAKIVSHVRYHSRENKPSKPFIPKTIGAKAEALLVPFNGESDKDHQKRIKEFKEDLGRASVYRHDGIIEYSLESKDGESAIKTWRREIAFRDTMKQLGNLGYRAGMIKKSEPFAVMGGRGTGHFGTGVYFVGSEAQADDFAEWRRGDETHAVDFSRYNLWKPTGAESGYFVHNFFKKLNDNPRGEFDSYEGEENAFNSNIWKAAVMLDVTTEELKYAIKEAFEFYKDKNRMDHGYLDTPSTFVMKKLGYDGVDVRGIKELDNTTYGSVIYDLNPEDVRFHSNNESSNVSNYSTKPSDIVNAVNELGNELGYSAKVVDTLDDIPNEYARRAIATGERNAYFDVNDGRVYIYLPYVDDVNEAKRIVLHEVLGHKGLRQLIGEDEYDAEMIHIYEDLLPKKYKKQILNKVLNLGRDYRASGNKSHVRSFLAEAVDEWLAERAELFDVQPSFFDKIRAMFRNMLRSIGININLNDNDIDYMMWRSYLTFKQNGNRSISDHAMDMMMRQKYGIDGETDFDPSDPNGRGSRKDIRFNSKKQVPPTMANQSIAGQEYLKGITGLRNDLKEAYHDGLRSVRVLQEAVVKQSGMPLEDYEDVYRNALFAPRVNKAEWEAFMSHLVDPFMDAVRAITNPKKKSKRPKKSQLEIEHYLNAVHGIERNEIFARRDADKQASEEFDEKIEEAIKAGDTATQTALEQQKADRADELYAINRLKDYSGLTEIFKLETDPDDITLAEIEQRAQDYADNFKNEVGDKAVDRLWKSLESIRAFIIDKEWKSGYISRETRDKLNTMFNNYVPLRDFRSATAEDIYEYSIASGITTQTVIRNASGRRTEAGNILANLMNMAHSAINQGNKNLVNQCLLRLAEDHPTPLLSVHKEWYQRTATGSWVPVVPTDASGMPLDTSDMTAEERANALSDFEERMKAEKKARPGQFMEVNDLLKLGIPIKKKQHEIEHQVVVYRNGKRYVVSLNSNPKATMALNGTLMMKEESKIINALSIPTRWMGRAVTTLNPEFMLSNMQRDLIASTETLGAKYGAKYTAKFAGNVAMLLPMISPIPLVGTIARAGNRVVGGKRIGIFQLYSKYKDGTLDMSNEVERYFKEFIENGGETGFSHVWSVDKYQDELRRKTGIGREGKLGKVIDFLDDATTPLQVTADAIDEVNRRFENICRFAAYMTSRQMGRSKLQSIDDAAEASVNFNRKGSGALGNSLFKTLYIFFNAGVQGLAQRLKLMSSSNPHHNRARAIFIAQFAFGFFNTALNILLGGDGDDDDDDYIDNKYMRISDFRRRNSFNVMLSDGCLRWDFSHEDAAIYGLGCLLGEYIFGYGHANAKDISEEILGQVSMALPMDVLSNNISEGKAITQLFKSAVPTGVKPIVEAYLLNEDFAERQINNQRGGSEIGDNHNLPEYERARRNTNRFFNYIIKNMSESMGGTRDKRSGLERLMGDLAPNADNYNHVFSGYLGGPYTIIEKGIRIVDDAITKVNGGDMEERELWRDAPFANRLYTGALSEWSKNRLVKSEFDYYLDKVEPVEDGLNNIKRDKKNNYFKNNPKEQTEKERKEVMMSDEDYKYYKIWEVDKKNGKSLKQKYDKACKKSNEAYNIGDMDKYKKFEAEKSMIRREAVLKFNKAEKKD